MLLVAICFLFTGLGYGCADQLILPPAPPHVSLDGATQRLLKSDGEVIEVYIARSPGAAKAEPRAFVLRFTGGNAAEAAAFTASRWRDRPVEVWTANYPGYGASSGPRKLKRMAPMAVKAFDQLKQVAGDRPIIVDGFSLGTVPALAVAAQRPVAGVIIQNPPPLRELIIGGHGRWNLWLLALPVAEQVPSDRDSLANARAAHARCIFLFAENDRTIPLHYQQQIAGAYAGEKTIILQRGADHVTPLSTDDEQKLQNAMDWLLK